MKKVRLSIVALLLVMLAVTGISINAAPKVTLKFWHLWTTPAEANKVAIDQVLAKFSKAYPNIKVEVDAVENETYKTKIKTAIAANEAPDVFFTWGGGFSQPFVDAGKLLDLTPYLNDGGGDEVTQIMPQKMEPFKIYNVKKDAWHTHTLSKGAMVVIVENRDTTDTNSPEIVLTEEQRLRLINLAEAEGFIV